MNKVFISIWIVSLFSSCREVRKPTIKYAFVGCIEYKEMRKKAVNVFLPGEVSKKILHVHSGSEANFVFYVQLDCIFDKGIRPEMEMLDNQTIGIFLVRRRSGLSSNCTCFGEIKMQLNVPEHSNCTILYMGKKYR